MRSSFNQPFGIRFFFRVPQRIFVEINRTIPWTTSGNPIVIFYWRSLYRLLGVFTLEPPKAGEERINCEILNILQHFFSILSAPISIYSLRMIGDFQQSYKGNVMRPSGSSMHTYYQWKSESDDAKNPLHRNATFWGITRSHENCFQLCFFCVRFPRWWQLLSFDPLWDWAQSESGIHGNYFQNNLKAADRPFFTETSSLIAPRQRTQQGKVWPCHYDTHIRLYRVSFAFYT